MGPSNSRPSLYATHAMKQALERNILAALRVPFLAAPLTTAGNVFIKGIKDGVAAPMATFHQKFIPSHQFLGPRRQDLADNKPHGFE